MVAHHPLHVVDANLTVGLHPQRESLALAVHHVWKIGIHPVGEAVEIAPDTAVTATCGSSVELSIGKRETKILVLTLVVAHLAGEVDDIGRIDGVFLIVEREFVDARMVGMTRDAIVGDAACHPDSALLLAALADELHDPSLLRVGDRE